MSEWNKIEDGYPKEGQSYLIVSTSMWRRSPSTRAKEVSIARLEKLILYTEGTELPVWRIQSYQFGESHINIAEGVTHWKEIPVLPEFEDGSGGKQEGKTT